MGTITRIRDAQSGEDIVQIVVRLAERTQRDGVAWEKKHSEQLTVLNDPLEQDKAVQACQAATTQLQAATRALEAVVDSLGQTRHNLNRRLIVMTLVVAYLTAAATAIITSAVFHYSAAPSATVADHISLPSSIPNLLLEDNGWTYRP